MEQQRNYIKKFHVQQLWKRMNLNWTNVNEDVNILVGINGCGKTTLLNLIYDYYTKVKPKTEIAEAVNGTPTQSELNIPITYIRSFDVPAKVKSGNAAKKTESVLLQELKHIINQNGEGTSFFDYRMKMLNYPEKADEIQKRIELFFQLINSLFKETKKAVFIEQRSNTLAFSVDEKTTATELNVIQIAQLSSGEKQLLLILTTVFLQEEKPNILLMDEPEISLHISWQDRLIETIRQLNPNCQLVLTTHSPNIFASGWEDKLVFVEDLEEKV